MPAFAGVVINEGFENVAGLAGSGWLFVSKSAPAGATPGWFQGNSSIFSAQSGGQDSYAAANYNNSTPGGSVASYLLTPLFDASQGADISFYLRSAGEGYTDRIAYGVVGGGALKLVSPVPDNGWTQYTAHIDPTKGGTRFLFEYLGNADTLNYVGLDSVVVNVPEPASIALLCGGLLGLGAVRRRARR